MTREVGKIVLIAAGFVLVLIVLVALFSDRSDRSASPLSSATGRSTDSRSSSGSRNGLNNGSVQTAVDEAFQELRRVAGRQSMPFNSGGRAVVEGIQEMPADNSARVNVRYEDAVFREPWTYTTNYRRISSGYAVLAHYSDGRWVLTELHTDDTMYLSFVKTNINVP